MAFVLTSRASVRSALIGLVLCVSALTTAPGALAAEREVNRDISFIFDQNALTVSTGRYRATFGLGCMTSLVNKLTGETYSVGATALRERLKHLPQGLGTMASLPRDESKYGELGLLHNWQGSYPMDTTWRSMHHPSPRSKIR